MLPRPVRKRTPAGRGDRPSAGRSRRRTLRCIRVPGDSVGHGIEATVDGRAVLIGKRELLESRGVSITLAGRQQLAGGGCTAMLSFAIDGDGKPGSLASRIVCGPRPDCRFQRRAGCRSRQNRGAGVGRRARAPGAADALDDMARVHGRHGDRGRPRARPSEEPRDWRRGRPGAVRCGGSRLAHRRAARARRAPWVVRRLTRRSDGHDLATDRAFAERVEAIRSACWNDTPALQARSMPRGQSAELHRPRDTGGREVARPAPCWRHRRRPAWCAARSVSRQAGSR